MKFGDVIALILLIVFIHLLLIFHWKFMMKRKKT